MRRTKIAITSIVGLAALAACAQSVDVRILDSSGIYEPGASRALIVFSTSRAIGGHIESKEVRPAEGLISICGLADQYYAYGPITSEHSGRYQVILPGMDQRIHRMPDGQVVSGWPTDLARQSGVCFRVEAAEMMWMTLTSNEVPLPR